MSKGLGMSIWEKYFFLGIGLLVLGFFNACGGFQSAGSSEGAASQLSNSELAFKCTNPMESSETKTYILSKKQYENSIKELFGANTLTAVSAVISAIPNVSNDADTQQRISSLSASEIQAYFNAAEAISSHIIGNNSEVSRVFGSCANQSSPSSTCIDQYLNQFAPRILGRPLNSDELSFAQTLMSQSGTYKENIKALLSYHLQSPYFIWGVELGSGTSDGVSQDLTAFEVARRISLMTMDSIPDQELYQAAVNGQLTSQTQIKAQVRRLLQTDFAKEKLTNILLNWSHSDYVKDLSNLPIDLSTGLDTNGLENAMLAEAKTFVEHIVYTKQGSFQDLLKSKESFAQHRGLASIYQHSPSNGTPEIMGGRRQGLLLRSPSLTWYTERTSIIHRGVDFQKRVLCNEIPIPNVDISNDRDADALTDQEKLQYSNREVIAHQTRSPVCMSCHSIINPTGFAFENFDSFGRIRAQEMVFDTQGTLQNNINVDSTAQIPLPNNQSLPVADAYDLVDYVATSPQGAACFATNMFRYVYEKKESPKDGCQLTNTYNAVFDSQQSVLDAMTELIANSYLDKKYMD